MEDEAGGFGDELLGRSDEKRGGETKARNEEDEGRERRRNSERGMEMKLQDEDEAGGFGDEYVEDDEGYEGETNARPKAKLRRQRGSQRLR